MLKLREWPEWHPEVQLRNEPAPRAAKKTIRRSAVRWEVGVKRLMQQGLTRHEAEEQMQMGLW